MDRRNFLRLGVAAAAAAAIPEVASAALGYDKSPIEQEDIDFVQGILKDPAKMAVFRKEGTPRQALSLVRMLARWDTTAAEKKERKLHKGAMQLFDAKRILRGQGTKLRVAYSPAPGTTVERYFVVTANHVAENGALAPGGVKWVKHPKGYDVAVCEVGVKDTALDALDFDVTKPDQDSTARIGTIAGNDDDSGRLETKAHSSHLSPILSPHLLWKALGVSQTTRSGGKTPFSGEEVRMAIIRREQAQTDARGVAPWMGMSGAGVTDENGELLGIDSTSVYYDVPPKINNEAYGLEFIIDRKFIRETILEAMKQRPSLARM